MKKTRCESSGDLRHWDQAFLELQADLSPQTDRFIKAENAYTLTLDQLRASIDQLSEKQPLALVASSQMTVIKKQVSFLQRYRLYLKHLSWMAVFSRLKTFQSKPSKTR